MRSDNTGNGSDNIAKLYGLSPPERLAVVEEQLKNAPSKDDLHDLERKLAREFADLDKSVTNQISGLKDFVRDEMKQLSDRTDDRVKEAEAKNHRWWSLAIIVMIALVSPASAEVLSFMLGLIR